MDNSTSNLSAPELVSRFTRFLADELNIVTAQETLQIMLRTEGKVFFTPAQIANIAFRWASSQEELTGIPLYRSLCTSLLRIYQAQAFCSLPLFRLEDFIRPFLGEIFRLTPPEERDMLREELPHIKEEFDRSLLTDAAKKMPEYEVALTLEGDQKVTEGEWIRLTGERYQEVLPELQAAARDPELSYEERLKQLGAIMPRVRATFDNIINETILKQRLPILIWLGRDLFNRDEIPHANLILGFVAEVVDQRNDQFLAKEVAGLLKLDNFNQDLINSFLHDAQKKHLLRPLLSNIYDTRPDSLLSGLTTERDAEKRKQLLLFLTVYEPDIFHKLLAELRGKHLAKWYFQRNLLLLTTRVKRPSDIPISAVLEVLADFIHPRLHANVVQEAIHSYIFWDGTGGIELTIRILRTEDLAELIDLDQYYSPQEVDAFKTAVAQGASKADISHNPAAVDVIMTAIQEEQARGRSRFLLGGSLNQKLVTQILGLLASSPSPYVIQSLQQLISSSGNSAIRTIAQNVLTELQKEHSQFI